MTGKSTTSQYCTKVRKGRAWSPCGSCGGCRKHMAQVTADFNRAFARGDRAAMGLRKDLITRETPLRSPGRAPEVCTERPGCICTACRAWTDASRERQAQLAKALAGFRSKMDIIPGQEDFGAKFFDRDSGWIYLQNGDDLQVCLPITTAGQLRSKMSAEHDNNPKSQDWADAPGRARDVYDSFAEQVRTLLESGSSDPRIETVPGKFDAELEWLSQGNGAPLLVRDGRFIRLLRDPVSTEPQPRYPGCPPGVNPKAGRTLGEKGRMIILWIRSTSWGSRLTQRDSMRVANSAECRELFQITDCRYMSETTCSNIHVALRKEGLIRVVQGAVHYRRNHHWALESAAVYSTVLGLLPEQETAISICIRAALAAKSGELRERLKEAS